MAEDIIIDATQYTNLVTTYSEKNNIDNIKGTEYRITGTELIDFTFADNNPYVDESGLMTINYVQHNDNDTTPTYSFAGINDSAFPFDNLSWDYDQASHVVNDLYGTRTTSNLRTENYVLQGTLHASTTEVIQDINSIAASCTIKYNSYHFHTGQPDQQIITQTNMNRNTQNPVFEIIRTQQYQVNKQQNMDGEWETTEQTVENSSIPYQQSTYTYQSPTGVIYSYVRELKYQPALCELSKPRVTVSDSGTSVDVDYKITIWFGATDVVIAEWGVFTQAKFYDYYLDNIVEIQFQVQGKSIQTEENEFKYGDGQYKEYELETNELMQYMEGQDYTTRQSYITSEKMLDQTQINRMIVSFDLLDCSKIVDYVVREGSDTEEPVVMKRFLDTGDLIKLKDQNDNFIGQYYDDNGTLVTPYFEIISYHGRWDGTFHVEIVCKQKL